MVAAVLGLEMLAVERAVERWAAVKAAWEELAVKAAVRERSMPYQQWPHFPQTPRAKRRSVLQVQWQVRGPCRSRRCS